MSRYAGELYLDSWIRPFVDISKWEFYDLSCKARDNTNDQVLTDAIKAKIFGLNNARIYGIDPAAVLKAVTEDGLSKAKVLLKAGELPYRNCSRGPRTRREFFAMLRAGDPGIHTYGVNV